MTGGDLRSAPVSTRHGWTRVLYASGPEPTGTVLFLHGASARADRWGRAVRTVAELGMAGYAVDFPGHGFADRDPASRFDMEAMVEFVGDVLDTIGRAPVAVVGTSFGGFVACHVARHRPELVRGVLAVGPLGIVPLADDIAALLAASLADSSREGVETKTRVTVHRREIVDSEWLDVEHAFARRTADGDGLAGLRSYLSPPDRVNAELVTPWLDELAGRIPVTIACGDHDLTVDVAGIEQTVATLPRVGFAGIEGAGHLPYVEQPEQFEKVLAVWLDDVDFGETVP